MSSYAAQDIAVIMETIDRRLRDHDTEVSAVLRRIATDVWQIPLVTELAASLSPPDMLESGRPSRKTPNASPLAALFCSAENRAVMKGATGHRTQDPSVLTLKSRNQS
ncbi:hypothetical protein [Thioclava indica]|uniref:hypothetical protein n=1 Tax=Thioclava indica TaxID=1353528 RepID=UPI0012DE35F8|nr:hypothetical protein [Thioclava indica]